MTYTHGVASKINEKEYKKTLAVELYLRKHTQAQIAQKFEEMGYKVDRSQVSRWLAEARAEWREERLSNMDEIYERELAALDSMEIKVAEAFERFEPKGTEEDLFEYSKAAARWMDERLKIMETRNKLLGLNKPVKVDIDAKTDVKLDAESTEKIRNEILDRLAPKHKDVNA